MKSRKFHVCVPPLSHACKIIASNTTVVCSKDIELLTVSGLFIITRTLGALRAPYIGLKNTSYVYAQ